MAKNKKKFWQSNYLNNSTYIMYYNKLVELAMSMFEWKNLPDTVDPRFLELALLTDGKAIFFKDDELGYLTLRCTMNGDFNEYNISKKRTAYASNGYTNQLNDSNSVVIFNDLLRSPSMREIELFACKLTNLDRAIDVNANAQKTPIVICCPEDQQFTLENVYKQYDGNIPVIVAYDSNNPDKYIRAVSTGAPYVADRLYTLKTQIWNEALTHLGITNVNIMKKERLVSDEVIRNQGGTVASRYSRLDTRQQACKQINKMFNLNVQCEFKETFIPIDSNNLLNEGGKQ